MLVEMSEAAANSEDAALIQQLKTMDSLEAKLNNFQTAWQEFYTDTGIEKLIKGIVDAGTMLLSYFSETPKLFGMIPIAAIGSLTMLVTALKTVGNSLVDTLSKAWKDAKERVSKDAQEAGEAHANSYNSAVQKGTKEASPIVDNQQTKQGVSNLQKLTDKAVKYRAALMAASVVAQTVGTGLMASSEKDGSPKAIAGGLINMAGGALQGAVTGASLGSAAGPWGMIIGAVAGLGISALSSLDVFFETAEEKLERLKKEATELKNESIVQKNEATTLEDAIKKYEQLKEAQYDSAEAKQEFIEYSQQMAEDYPTLISQITGEGEAVLDVGRAYAQAAQSKQDYYEKNEEYIASELAVLDEERKQLEEDKNSAWTVLNNFATSSYISGLASDFSYSTGQKLSDEEEGFLNNLRTAGLEGNNDGLIDALLSIYEYGKGDNVESAYAFKGKDSIMGNLINTLYRDVANTVGIAFDPEDYYEIDDLLSIIPGFEKELLLNAEESLAFNMQMAMSKISSMLDTKKFVNYDDSNYQEILNEASQTANSVFTTLLLNDFKSMKEEDSTLTWDSFYTDDIETQYSNLMDSLMDALSDLTDADITKVLDTINNIGDYGFNDFEKVLTNIFGEDSDIVPTLIEYYEETLAETKQRVLNRINQLSKENTGLTFWGSTGEFAYAMIDNFGPEVAQALIEQAAAIAQTSPKELRKQGFIDYSKLFANLDSIEDAGLQNQVADIFAHQDLTSIYGTQQAVNALEEIEKNLPEGADKKAITESIEQLRTTSSIIIPNINSELNSYMSDVNASLVSLSDAISNATEGMDTEAANQLAAALGTDLITDSNFEFRDGKWFYNDLQALAEHYTSEYDGYMELLETALFGTGEGQEASYNELYSQFIDEEGNPIDAGFAKFYEEYGGNINDALESYLPTVLKMTEEQVEAMENYIVRQGALSMSGVQGWIAALPENGVHIPKLRRAIRSENIDGIINAAGEVANVSLQEAQDVIESYANQREQIATLLGKGVNWETVQESFGLEEERDEYIGRMSLAEQNAFLATKDTSAGDNLESEAARQLLENISNLDSLNEDAISQLATGLEEKYETVKGWFEQNSDGSYSITTAGMQEIQAATKNMGLEISSVVADRFLANYEAIMDSLESGLGGDLSNVDAFNLLDTLSDYGLDVDFNEMFIPTADGLKIVESELGEIYTLLGRINPRMQETFRDSLIDSDLYKSFDSVQDVIKHIREIESELAKEEGDPKNEVRIKALRDELALAKDILRVRSMENPDDFNFMDNSLPDMYQSPVNYWNSVNEAYTAMKEGLEDGYMDVQDFYNIMMEMERMGVEFADGSMTVSDLLSQGFRNLTMIDGEGVQVNLEALGDSFAAGVAGMGGSFENGFKEMAKQQIQWIDSQIAMLEGFAVIEQLDNLTTDTGEQQTFFDNVEGLFFGKDFAFGDETFDTLQEVLKDTKLTGVFFEEYVAWFEANEGTFDSAEEYYAAFMQFVYDFLSGEGITVIDGQDSADKTLEAIKNDVEAFEALPQEIKELVDSLMHESGYENITVEQVFKLNKIIKEAEGGGYTFPGHTGEPFQTKAEAAKAYIDKYGTEKDGEHTITLVDPQPTTVETQQELIERGVITKSDDEKWVVEGSKTTYDTPEEAYAAYKKANPTTPSFEPSKQEVEDTTTYDIGEVGKLQGTASELKINTVDSIVLAEELIGENGIELTNPIEKVGAQASSAEVDLSTAQLSQKNSEGEVTELILPINSITVKPNIVDIEMPETTDEEAGIVVDGTLNLDVDTTSAETAITTFEIQNQNKKITYDVEFQYSPGTDSGLDDNSGLLTSSPREQLNEVNQGISDATTVLIANRDTYIEAYNVLKAAIENGIAVPVEDIQFLEDLGNALTMSGMEGADGLPLVQNLSDLAESAKKLGSSTNAVNVARTLSQLDAAGIADALSEMVTSGNTLVTLDFTNFSNLETTLTTAQTTVNDIAAKLSAMNGSTVTVNVVQRGSSGGGGGGGSSTTNSSKSGGGSSGSKTVTTSLDTSGALASLEVLNAAIKRLGVSASLAGAQSVVSTSNVTNLANAINKLTDRSRYVSNLASAIRGLSDRSKQVNNTAAAIKKLESKSITATVTVKVTTQASGATGNVSISSKGTSTRKGSVPGTTTKMVSMRSYAKGGVALAGGQRTLMGELGPELVVSNGRYFLVGQSGAEFVNLPTDAIVFNHLQTQSLMNRGHSTQGKPVTNEKKAVSYAKGTGPAMASATELIAQLKDLRAMWESLLNMSASDFAKKAGSGGGGGGGGGGDGGGDPEQLKAYIHDLERWYNLLRQIEDYERRITYQQKLRENMTSGYTYVDSLEEELELLKAQQKVQQQLSDLQKDFYDKRRQELLNSDYSKIFTYNENGLMQYVDGAGKGLDILATVNQTGDRAMTAQQQVAYLNSVGINTSSFNVREDGSKIERKDFDSDQAYYEELMGQFWDNTDGWMEELDSLYDSYNEALNDVQDSITAQNEIMQQYVDNQLSVEERVLTALIDQKQAEIDLLQDELDAFQDAADSYISGLQDTLSREQEMYNKNSEADETERLQKQLAILQRSGGSASQIASLQDQIDSRLQDDYFNAMQEQIDAIQEASDNQLEKLQTQIDIQTEALEYQKENGLLWEEVYQMMTTMTPEALLDFIETYTKSYQENSGLQNQEDSKEALKEFEIWAAKREKDKRDSAWEDYYNNANYDDDIKQKYKDAAQDAFNKAYQTGGASAGAAAADEVFKAGMNSGSGGTQGGNTGGETTPPPPEPEKPYTTTGKVKTNGGNLYVRSGPSTKYSTLGRLKNGSTATVTGYNGSWFRIQYGSKVGYVSGDWFRVNGDVGKLPRFKTGGDVDFTGLAMLDGTTSKPETILGSTDANALKKAIFGKEDYSLRQISSRLKELEKNNIRIPESNEINIGDISINIETEAISSDYDARRAGEQVMSEILEIARKSTTLTKSRR